jgi:hypothetical protein
MRPSGTRSSDDELVGGLDGRASAIGDRPGEPDGSGVKPDGVGQATGEQRPRRSRSAATARRAEGRGAIGDRLAQLADDCTGGGGQAAGEQPAS